MENGKWTRKEEEEGQRKDDPVNFTTLQWTAGNKRVSEINVVGGGAERLHWLRLMGNSALGGLKYARYAVHPLLLPLPLPLGTLVRY